MKVVQGLILGLLLPCIALAEQQYYGTQVSTIELSGAESQADLELLPIHLLLLRRHVTPHVFEAGSRYAVATAQNHLLQECEQRNEAYQLSP